MGWVRVSGEMKEEEGLKREERGRSIQKVKGRKSRKEEDGRCDLCYSCQITHTLALCFCSHTQYITHTLSHLFDYTHIYNLTPSKFLKSFPYLLFMHFVVFVPVIFYLREVTFSFVSPTHLLFLPTFCQHLC